MALQATYKQFLAVPNSSALSSNASLHYITTTTSFSGPTEVIKHLIGLRNHVKKTKEEPLSAVEGNGSLGLAVELDTTLEFGISGGPYLPSLDDNFVADRTVHLLITHFVSFDSDGKITQIRQTWDQGSLLKQLDVIGKSGRNWPIRDSQEQINLITKCVKTGGGGSATGQSSAASAVSAATEEMPVRSRGNSANIMRDPHASLSLFAPRTEAEPAQASVISPYAGSARPRQRDITEILGDPPEGEQEEEGSPTQGRSRSSSKSTVAPKGGSSKNYQPIRLFEGVEEEPDSPEHHKSPDRFYRPNPKKYQHFDFADGSDPADGPSAGASFDDVKTKHNSQWSFEDFVTPQKPKPRPTRSQEVRHWGTDKDEIAETPAAARPAPPKPRRDAEPHFEFQDDGPSGQPRPAGRPRGSTHNDGLGLYKNNVYDESGKLPEGPDTRALGNITNIKDRRRDFDSQFGLTDESPRQAEPAAKGAVPEGRKKAVKMMEANWAAFDESPASQKENSQPAGHNDKAGNERGIAIAGDGMGGKKGAGGRGWGIGDESQAGITIAGDGMGGKKGASGRGWSIGDESGGEEQKQNRPVAGKKQGASTAKGGGFWDF